MNKQVFIQLSTAALLLTLNLAAAAEEIIRPRGQAAYEAELKALNAKYGPQGKVSELREKTEGDPPLPAASSPSAAPAAALKAGEPAAKALRVTLLPVGENQFMLAEQVYDGAALGLQLAQMQAKQPLDSVILLSDEDRQIGIPHLIELARLGRELNFPALYQDGEAIKAIAGR